MAKIKNALAQKKDKKENLTIHNTEILSPEEPLPVGSIFKDYCDFYVQDILIQPNNTCYRMERWVTPDGKIIKAKLPDSVGNRHFGPKLRAFILYQHHQCQTTQPLLLEQLREWGIDISSGQINRILTENNDNFHAEKDELLQTALSANRYISVDDSGARHQGKNGYVTQMGNEFFAWFSSTNSKSRINFLELLRAGHEDYQLTGDAFDYMADQGAPKSLIATLALYQTRCFENKEAWEIFLENLPLTNQRHIRLATEGALMGSILAHHDCHNLAILSDDAGQFNVFEHALCWIHTERLVHKMIPLNDAHREDLAEVRGQIWDFYRDLKAYTFSPAPDKIADFRLRFDEIFSQSTRYITLNNLLKRIKKNKEELLLVLTRPDIPLHTNGSETDIRDYVKKRKISGGTRSDEGRRSRDTFTSLKKTCRKLGISFWEYLQSRLGLLNSTPIQRLSEIMRAKISNTPSY
jgi:hypothetical protein